MKALILILLISLTKNLAFSQTDCQKAIDRAFLDFNKSEFSFHSAEFLPTENTYIFVLNKNYKINWYFTDSLDYYKCYDSEMTRLLEQKYGNGFLKKADYIADSLSKTPNWNRDIEFPGGHSALFEFLSSNLLRKAIKIDSVTTPSRILIQFEIDTKGRVVNPLVLRGENKYINKQVIKVINQMPNWIPAYLYGKPIMQRWTMPIFIVNKNYVR